MKGYAFNSTADFELIREIKEKYCFVAGDLEVERKLAKETTIHEKDVRLPDGTSIKIGRERFEGPELLFTPGFGGYECEGVSDLVFNSINNSSVDIRRALYGSVMISGGTSMFPGFPTRLNNDLRKLYEKIVLKGKKDPEKKMKIKIIDPPRRRYNVYIGGTVVANAMKN